MGWWINGGDVRIAIPLVRELVSCLRRWEELHTACVAAPLLAQSRRLFGLR